MLAGAAPAPAVLLAVAADEGWMPQTAEHLEALGALGVRSGVLAVTKADAADPRLALRLVRDKLAGTALRGMEAVPVSTVTGAGIDELTAALDRLAGRAARPRPGRPGAAVGRPRLHRRAADRRHRHPHRRDGRRGGRAAPHARRRARPGADDRLRGGAPHVGRRRLARRADPARRGPRGGRHGPGHPRRVDPHHLRRRAHQVR
ncbi:GTP-binding protein [Actinomadura madurae]|uniref:GTP-binding protein n=1 Tax=Actinomadura madurae TaxID=1993 RepID=UPI0020D234C1|nr:GTP-binding protein [Actinomadura madurae]MCQ0011358.1 GTP-binding protein [Actinomadura madurae]